MELISKELFNTYYHLLYGITFLIVLGGALQLDIKKNKLVVDIFFRTISLFLLVAFIFLIGFRAYNVGTDTGNYYQFNWLNNRNSKGFEILFEKILFFIKYINGSFTSFLLLISFLFFFTIYKGYTIISEVVNTQVLFIFFAFISLFFAKSLSINVLRQGISLALLVYAFAIWLKSRSVKKSTPFLILSFISHTTAIIPISIFFLIIYKLKKVDIKFFLGLYALGIVLSLANFGILNIAPFLKDMLGDERRLGYLTNESESYTVGFKPQFVAFNTVFTVLYYYISKKLLKTSIKEDYDILFKYYLLTSFLFFMAFQIPFSDRWGLFGWITIPILASPLFSFNNYIKINKTIGVLFFGSIYLFFAFYG